MTYFNTTNLKGKELSTRIAKAKTQNDKVMAIFTHRPILSPSQVLFYFPEPKPLLTSIRRSISVLTSQGKLEKMDQVRSGLYGAAEHYWKAL